MTRLTLRTADRCGMQRDITAQVLPGGFCAGEELYYTGRSHVFFNFFRNAV